MAFQPIIDIEAGTILAQEALLRGKDGSGAGAILAQVSDDNRYVFDQTCRRTAIEVATTAGLAETDAFLSINFLPNAVYEPRACIRLTLETAKRTGFPLDRIMFEFTEAERLDAEHLLNILRAYRSLGFRTAIDDFGAGYAGLELLSRFQPDIVKLDMALVRDIESDPIKRGIVRHMVRMLADLGVDLVCEGIETVAEYGVLRDLGVTLMQGYLFGRPEIERLPAPIWPNEAPAHAAAG
ncbi:MAG: EAL domain-containing protein [Phyllobacteriaceae bacterium]|nr:EAL domain-containing protein [Phyllobacteriaceae bacterium]